MFIRLALFLSLSACTTFAVVDTARFTISGPDAAPALLPIADVNALAGQPLGAQQAQADLDARAARLRAEAAALRGQ